MSTLDDLRRAVIDGEVSRARKLAESATGAGFSPDAVFTGALTPAMGVDVPAQRFADAVREVRPRVLGMSAMLTITMLEMSQVMQTLEAEGSRSKAKVVVGGAPLDQSFADEIGPDGFGVDATSAVNLAKWWVSAR